MTIGGCVDYLTSNGCEKQNAPLSFGKSEPSENAHFMVIEAKTDDESYGDELPQALI